MSEQKKLEPLDREIIFKGCTRPAMLLGVPIAPFVFIIGGSFLFLFIFLNVAWTALIIPIWYCLRVIAKEDDQRFRAIGIEFITISDNRNKNVWRLVTFQPVVYRKKKNDKRTR